MPHRSIVARATIALIGFAVAAAGCTAPPSPSPPNPQAADSLVIRQILVGVPGDNNGEFIELYNPASTPFNLDGYQLVYRLATSDEDLPVAEFKEAAYVPPYGFYLLAREGAGFELTPDAIFQQSLNNSGGGLGLLDSDGVVVDAVGWGRAPERLREGEPAPAVQNGIALVRRELPDAPVVDTDENGDDFVAASEFQPHNSGSTALLSDAPAVRLIAQFPEMVDPGQIFSARFQLGYGGQSGSQDLQVDIPLPPGVTVSNPASGVTQIEQGVTWQVDGLESGDSTEIELTLQAPWRFGQLRFPSARARGQDAVAFSGPQVIDLSESPIPVTVARGLVNQDVMVEGTATIYTGGLFAGSGNVKFYMSDDSGGVQVWVPGGEGTLRVDIGDAVRVRGRIERYRGTIELIAEPPTAVEVLDAEQRPLTPVNPALDEMTADPETFAGQLIRVEGELSQADESSFGFDLQIRNDRGAALFAYIDKMTGLGIDRLTLDQPYALTGILETPDGVPTLYPRIEQDLDRRYPSSLVLEVDSPPSLLPNESATIRLKLANHTDQAVHDLSVRAPLPIESASWSEISDGGQIAGDTIVWTVDRIDPGEVSVVSFALQSRIGSGVIQLPAVTIADSTGQIQVEADPASIYVGDSVPVHAIQGAGDRSPFVGQDVRTEGTVTAVFPDLEGFFIQGSPDDNPATPEGIFVTSDPLPPDVQVGDTLSLAGTIREIGHQTAIQIERLGQVEILRTDEPLPAAQPLDPPAGANAAAAYYESLEGMVVAIDEPAVAIGPTNQYGETPLVLARYDVTRIFREDPPGRMITVDDGSDFYHEDRSQLPFAVTTGQRLSDVIGPLAFTFGQFKIEPVNTPQVSGPAAQPPTPISSGEEAFRVMTWNAENLFDILEPNPSSPPRPHKDEYDLDLDKVAATIELAGAPTIVALQEVENIGILEDLVALPSLEAYAYQPLLLEGTDSRGIDVGYLVRSTPSDIVGVRQIPVPDGLTSRPPLELVLDVTNAGQSHRIAVYNNHFTALSAGVELTAPRRQAQAELNASAVRARMDDPTITGFIVLGDLNSFYQDPALSPLESIGMTDALSSVPAESRYTYIFEGVSQVLDHIYLSPGLSTCLRSTQILHVDADFPPPERTDRSALRKSDHDPVIATFGCLP